MSGTGSIARMPSPPDAAGAPERFWVETLGCPKNQVDSDRIIGSLRADGLVPAPSPDDASSTRGSPAGSIGQPARC